MTAHHWPHQKAQGVRNTVHKVHQQVRKNKKGQQNMSSVEPWIARLKDNASYIARDSTATVPVTAQETRQNTCHNKLLRDMSSANENEDGISSNEEDSSKSRDIKK